MKALFGLLFSLIWFFTSGKSIADEGRVFGNILGGVFLRCAPGCPPRHCLKDSAVIHGYCCGCARVTDRLPINCPGIHVQCPLDGRLLCKNYDYMLDCCCP